MSDFYTGNARGQELRRLLHVLDQTLYEITVARARMGEFFIDDLPTFAEAVEAAHAAAHQLTHPAPAATDAAAKH